MKVTGNCHAPFHQHLSQIHHVSVPSTSSLQSETPPFPGGDADKVRLRSPPFWSSDKGRDKVSSSWANAHFGYVPDDLVSSL